MTPPAPSSHAIRIAYIGTGHRAWGMIPMMREIPGCEIVAIADPTPRFRDRGATLAGPQVKVFSGHPTMLAHQKDIDAVVVAAPGARHPEPVIAALNRGLHVLCEKPIAVTIEDANRGIAAAGRSGKILQLDQQYRLRRNFSKMKQLVDAGEIGAIKSVSSDLHRRGWNPASWKTPHPKTKVPTLWRYGLELLGKSRIAQIHLKNEDRLLEQSGRVNFFESSHSGADQCVEATAKNIDFIRRLYPAASQGRRV